MSEALPGLKETGKGNQRFRCDVPRMSSRSWRTGSPQGENGMPGRLRSRCRCSAERRPNQSASHSLVIALGVVMGGELADLAGKEAASKPEARSSRPRPIGYVLSPTALGLLRSQT